MSWIKIGISAAALVAVFFTGWTVNGWRYQAKADAVHRAQIIEQAKQQKKVDATNAATAQHELDALSKIQALQDANDQLNQEIAHAHHLIHSEAPALHGNDSASCPVLGPDFLRLYNAASGDPAAPLHQAGPLPEKDGTPSQPPAG